VPGTLMIQSRNWRSLDERIAGECYAYEGILRLLQRWGQRSKTAALPHDPTYAALGT